MCKTALSVCSTVTAVLKKRQQFLNFALKEPLESTDIVYNYSVAYLVFYLHPDCSGGQALLHHEPEGRGCGEAS
jgi:hypothetical protein